MALPQDGQDANGLTKVTQIPAGKELMFIDPTTNEGGIITLEDLTKQILNGLASQAFALDAGQMTLPAALNYLYGKTSKFAADDCDNAWEQFTQNTSGKNGVLLGYGTIKGQTVTIIANKNDRGSSNYVGHMLTQDHIYVNNHYNSENHEKILV